MQLDQKMPRLWWMLAEVSKLCSYPMTYPTPERSSLTEVLATLPRYVDRLTVMTIASFQDLLVKLRLREEVVGVWEAG